MMQIGDTVKLDPNTRTVNNDAPWHYEYAVVEEIYGEKVRISFGNLSKASSTVHPKYLTVVTDVPAIYAGLAVRTTAIIDFWKHRAFVAPDKLPAGHQLLITETLENGWFRFVCSTPSGRGNVHRSQIELWED